MARRTPWQLLLSPLAIAAFAMTPAVAAPSYPFTNQIHTAPRNSVAVVLPRVINPLGQTSHLLPGTMVFAFHVRYLEYQDNLNGAEFTKTRALYEERVVRTPTSTLVINHWGHVDKYPLDAIVRPSSTAVALRFVPPSQAQSLPPDVRGMVPAYIVPMR